MKDAFIIFLCLLFAAPACLALEEREPVAAGHIEESVFRDVWQAVLLKSGIEFSLVRVSHEERRNLFIEGTIQLDCCSVKAWRAREAEMAVQLWTRPLFYTVDHLILKAGRQYDIKDPAALSDYSVAVVDGFTYPAEASFGSRVVVPSIAAALKAVAEGEADLTIVNSQEFRRLQKLEGLPLIMGPEHHRLVLRARVHKSRADLLPVLNEAIEQLHASGEIAKLTGARLRQR